MKILISIMLVLLGAGAVQADDFQLHDVVGVLKDRDGNRTMAAGFCTNSAYTTTIKGYPVYIGAGCVAFTSTDEKVDPIYGIGLASFKGLSVGAFYSSTNKTAYLGLSGSLSNIFNGLVLPRPKSIPTGN